MLVEEPPRPSVGCFVTAEMLRRIRHRVDMRLRAVGRREDDVVTGIDQCHYGDDQLVEILAGGSGAAALHFDPGRVGADDEHCSLRHKSSCAVVTVNVPIAIARGDSGRPWHHLWPPPY